VSGIPGYFGLLETGDSVFIFAPDLRTSVPATLRLADMMTHLRQKGKIHKGDYSHVIRSTRFVRFFTVWNQVNIPYSLS